MSRKTSMLFLPAAVLSLFLLQGCFTSIPVNPYSVKQEEPLISTKSVQAKPVEKATRKIAGKTESQLEPSKAPTSSSESSGKKAQVKNAPNPEKTDSTLLEKLYKKTEDLSRKLDAQERRIMKLEDEIKTKK